MPLPPKTSGMAVASMVLGIVALCIFSVGLLTGPIALVLGFLAINGINREPDRFKGKGMAIAGVVLGSIVVVLWLIIIIMIATGAIDIKQILECSSNPNAKGCPGA